MKKILVYLATYNGEKYLKEQLDSILNQKNVDVHILIGDDQSTDSTVNIIHDYINKYQNIKLIVNENNLGYRRNFMNLIHNNLDDNYDYFALSDQDDVWLENKLDSAINLLNAEDKIPLLYSSNLKVVDEKLNFMKMFFSKNDQKANVYKRFLENTATGCTCVFNNELRDKILKYPLTELKEPHDEIIEKIAIATGKYIFDSNAFILYRQHQNNQIGVNDKKMAKKHLDMLFGKVKMYHSYVAAIVYNIFQNEMRTDKIKNFIYNIGKYKKSFSSRMKILFTCKYKKTSFKKTFLFKISILTRRY